MSLHCNLISESAGVLAPLAKTAAVPAPASAPAEPVEPAQGGPDHESDGEVEVVEEVQPTNGDPLVSGSDAASITKMMNGVFKCFKWGVRLILCKGGVNPALPLSYIILGSPWGILV